jgi:hypothetical protein
VYVAALIVEVELDVAAPFPNTLNAVTVHLMVLPISAVTNVYVLEFDPMFVDGFRTH